MRDDGLIQVSPRHTVRLGMEYHHLIRQPPGSDYVMRTLARREAAGMPLMAAELVIASHETRERFPMAEEYPLHFRKTYYPGRLHGDPQIEYDRQLRASELIGVPPPIGHTPRTFRTCFLPGRPYSRMSPFGVEPEEGNIPLAKELPLASAAGLWRLLEQGYSEIMTLHAHNLTHGDLELHNLIVVSSPLELLLIDFENSTECGEDKAAWKKKCAADTRNLLREAIFLQCALGRQPGSMADAAWKMLDTLFKAPDRFRREIGDMTERRA